MTEHCHGDGGLAYGDALVRSVAVELDRVKQLLERLHVALVSLLPVQALHHQVVRQRPHRVAPQPLDLGRVADGEVLAEAVAHGLLQRQPLGRVAADVRRGAETVAEELDGRALEARRHSWRGGRDGGRGCGAAVAARQRSLRRGRVAVVAARSPRRGRAGADTHGGEDARTGARARGGRERAWRSNSCTVRRAASRWSRTRRPRKECLPRSQGTHGT
mmetsp:Transcript_25258/g.77883  ORF Transcript_25258/g.77883 Transcript_25258/m.77883 type:complete len:218 (+) Transcript_25258:722-1375(+)